MRKTGALAVAQVFKIRCP